MPPCSSRDHYHVQRYHCYHQSDAVQRRHELSDCEAHAKRHDRGTHGNGDPSVEQRGQQLDGRHGLFLPLANLLPSATPAKSRDASGQNESPTSGRAYALQLLSFFAAVPLFPSW